MFANALKKKLMTQTAVLAAPLLLVGCSSVPDAVNPVEWYNSTVEYFSEDDEPQAAATAETAAQGAVEEASAEVKKEVPSGFVAAQSASRQYAQPVVRQGQVVNALGDAEKVDVAAPPAPRAAPSTPVTKTQMADAKPAMAAPTQTAPQQAAPASPQRQNLSVSEVYAANLAQTRPTQMNATPQLGGYSDMPFETVVVSGNGVSRQGYAQPQPLQVASLNTGVRTDAYATNFAPSAVAEPNVVKNGQALSLARFNAAMYTGSFQVATIQFNNGSANLTGEDQRILREVLNIHRQQGGVVRVIGHASSRTRDMSADQHQRVNHSMSLSRADKVARQLLKLGMAGDRLFVGGVSDSQPLYQEVMPSGEAGNRRTEIFVDY